MFCENHVGLCLLGQTQVESELLDNDNFNAWLRETIYSLIEAEYCSRFIIGALNQFEMAFIRTLFGSVLLDDKIISRLKRGEGSVDFLLCLAEGEPIDYIADATKMTIEDFLPVPFRLPLTISPYCIPGDRRNKMYEMIDLSDFMVCHVANDASADDYYFLEYAKAAAIPVRNWFDSYDHSIKRGDTR